jgi:hypothetical protein
MFSKEVGLDVNTEENLEPIYMTNDHIQVTNKSFENMDKFKC